MNCGQKHLIGSLDDKDKVRRIPSEELVLIVTTIRSDYSMQNAPICEKQWFKDVQNHLLRVHTKNFSSQVRQQLIKQGIKVEAKKDYSMEQHKLPITWVCNICMLLIERDYELSLINL